MHRIKNYWNSHFEVFYANILQTIHTKLFVVVLDTYEVITTKFEEEKDGKVYPAEFYHTERGNYLLVNGYYFLRNTVSQNSISWRCTCYRSQKCRARAKVFVAKPNEALLGIAHHTHDTDAQRNIQRLNPIKKSLL